MPWEGNLHDGQMNYQSLNVEHHILWNNKEKNKYSGEKFIAISFIEKDIIISEINHIEKRYILVYKLHLTFIF